LNDDLEITEENKELTESIKKILKSEMNK